MTRPRQLSDDARKILTVYIASVYLVFTFLDLFMNAPCLVDWLRFTGIFACFLMAKRRKADLFLTLALFFTVCADACLLLLYWPPLGVLLFCFAHLFYILRNTGDIRLVVITACLSVTVSACLFYGLDLTLVTAFSIAYAILFLINILTALTLPKERPHKAMLLLGLLLFVLCDVNVAVYNLSLGSVSSVAGKLMWIFYMPSQVLLALS